jgi:hypothetical protein
MSHYRDTTHTWWRIHGVTAPRQEHEQPGQTQSSWPYVHHTKYTQRITLQRALYQHIIDDNHRIGCAQPLSTM